MGWREDASPLLIPAQRCVLESPGPSHGALTEGSDFLVSLGPAAMNVQDQEGDPMSNYVICINNDVNPASLIIGKVYRRLPDADAESHNMLRVVDEDKSELDGYLYPASMFAPVELPEIAERALMSAGA